MTTRANQGKSVVVVVEVVVVEVEVEVVVVVVVNGDGKVDWGLSNNSHSTWGGPQPWANVEWESRMGKSNAIIGCWQGGSAPYFLALH